MKRKQVAITVVYFAICAASTFFLVTSTLNYIEFYRAMSEITLQLLQVSASTGTKNVDLILVFSILNPTNCIGLRLRDFSYVLYFGNHSDQIDLYWDDIHFAETLTVERNWNKTFEYKIGLNPDREQTMDFIEIYKSRPENVLWEMKATLILITFVGLLDLPLTARLTSNL